MPESSRRPTTSLDRARSLAREALASEPAGLITDFDGTLSPIVIDPLLARPADGAATALASLAARLAVVAVVSGRGALDVRTRIGLDGLLVAGNHGTEWLEPKAALPTGSPDAARIRGHLDRALGSVPALEGVSVEDKGLSATIHWRAAPEPRAARAAVLDALGDPGPELALHPGRMSVEVRPVGLGDKGTAAAMVVERFGLRGVVVLGDDVTDLDMFRVVAALRSAGTVRAALIGVGGTGDEVPREVADAADVLVASPAAAVSLLRALGVSD